MNYLEMIKKTCLKIKACHLCPFFFGARCIGRKIPQEWTDKEIMQIDAYLTDYVLEEAKKHDQ